MKQDFLKNQKKELSFTLVEVIVTTIITFGLLATILSVYTLHQKAYRYGENAAETVQNGRVILERLSRELRQAKEVVVSEEKKSEGITEFPDIKENALDEIMFEDGHVSNIAEEHNPQAATENTIKLYGGASSTDDYYKGTFVKIISGLGSGETKEILEYDGTEKVATIRGTWDEQPTASSVYRIDSNYYYIRYYKEPNTSNIRRQVRVFYFNDEPDIYVPWNAEAENPEEDTLQSQTLSDEIIGEYVENLEFWGFPIINISINITKDEKSIDFSTKIYGRNL